MNDQTRNGEWSNDLRGNQWQAIGWNVWTNGHIFYHRPTWNWSSATWCQRTCWVKSRKKFWSRLRKRIRSSAQRKHTRWHDRWSEHLTCRLMGGWGSEQSESRWSPKCCRFKIWSRQQLQWMRLTAKVRSTSDRTHRRGSRDGCRQVKRQASFTSSSADAGVSRSRGHVPEAQSSWFRLEQSSVSVSQRSGRGAGVCRGLWCTRFYDTRVISRDITAASGTKRTVNTLSFLTLAWPATFHNCILTCAVTTIFITTALSILQTTRFLKSKGAPIVASCRLSASNNPQIIGRLPIIDS